MKLKILLLGAVMAVVGSSVTVLVIQSHQPAKAGPPNDQLPTALSNYSKTFKLNTSPPLWPGAKGATNGIPAK